MLLPACVPCCPQRYEHLCLAQEPQKPPHESLCRCGRAAACCARAAPPTGRLFVTHQKHHPPPARPPFPADTVPLPSEAIQVPVGPRESKCTRPRSPQASSQAQSQPAPLHHGQAAPIATPQQKQAQRSPSSSKYPNRCHIPRGATTLQAKSQDCAAESSVGTAGIPPGSHASVSQPALPLLCTQQSSHGALRPTGTFCLYTSNQLL